MKRTLALFLSLLLLLTLFAGCNQPVDGPGMENTGTAPANAPTDAPPATGDSPVGTDTPAPGGEEYSLPAEDGMNQIAFYWLADNVDLSKCDMWIWFPGADGRGYPFHQDYRGAKVVLNVPADVTEVGFIVRRDCSDPGGTSWGDATKDFDEDRFAPITGPYTEVWLKPGDGNQYISNDGGKTLSQNKEFSLAEITDLNKIRYHISPACRFSSLDQIKVLDGDREIPVESLSSLNNEVILGDIVLAEELDFSKTYTVSLEGYGQASAVPTKVFDSEAFIARYTYPGDDLGAVIDGDRTIFKLWAPTASEVVLNLYEFGRGEEPFARINMVQGDFGTWAIAADCGHGTYYSYTVTTSAGTQEAVDPYAKAVGINGDRGMVVDLSKTDPAGFAEDQYFQDINAYNEAIIWEVHVRDFSNRIAGSWFPGKYLAFTQTGLTNASGVPIGVEYLKDLGITHVHFQPIYDYATVDESKDTPQFNWGYDPKNYNAPEGSYSMDPNRGELRINELKQMVQALHQNGMGVVMDVVYNHTYDINSCLNKIVPYYYYRYNASGAPSNGSGCGNETASERPMFRKYMVDSVSYWAKEYHIDGFRFDLMALHDVDTMQAIEQAVHEINPKAILYGEGWTGGTSPLNDNLKANQANIRKVEATGEGIGAVAVFNDAIRDGLKGSVFDAKDQGYINGKANKGTADKVIFGIMGGVKSSGASWSVDDNMVVNYMACHDNNTIWDKLLESNPEASDEERYAMNRLGEEILMLSKGIPFMLAGEEFLRTKQGDHNSYMSSDEINNLDWDSLVPGSLQMRMHDLMKELIALRKANAFFTQGEPACEVLDNNVIRVVWTIDGETVAAALINPNDEAVPAELPEGAWTPLFTGETSAMDSVGAKDVLIVTP
ncbi:MAG: type I pullulanase [Oscillospiraceae bacterium]|nr:type I pullulanase [Oscillospiraceae bacterium]